VPINLLAHEQSAAAYLDLNPLGLVPALEQNAGRLTQSLAIIEYLDEVYPVPPLLPQDPWQRARARSLAETIACDIHPLNNLRVLGFLRDDLHVDQAGRDAWYAHWIRRGFTALERCVVAEPFALGTALTIADVCIVPQMFNARRFNVDLGDYPKLVAIDAAMADIGAVTAAHPQRQPDAV
jgi:maleylacetoacetate isomerase/maleylpyruvate isomerase